MLYTGYFAKTKKYIEWGCNVISIARYNPTGYNYATYLPLAPNKGLLYDYRMRHINNLQYTVLYQRATLDKLNPATFVKEMAEYGDRVVLLCYEKPERFCHRHIVAKWLTEAGFSTKELYL